MNAERPDELHRLFAECANDADLDGLLALYEPGATFVGPDGSAASGTEAIREHLGGLLALAPQITPLDSRVAVAGELALIASRWRMSFADEQAGSFEGASGELARRQPDGSWLYVIDSPSLADPAPAGSAVAWAPGFERLPYVDAHTIEIDAPAQCVWDTLTSRVLPRFGGGFGRLATGRAGRLGARLLRAPYPGPPEPGPGLAATIVGFRVQHAERPSLIALAGEHRFATYTLLLRIEPAAAGAASRLTAETHAAFPGAGGRAYRAVVIGTGAHRLVVNRLLSRVARMTGGD
ncbi:MAG TPA: nuclear transport factor 2 family protein [Solirubrobacteraceae bacterium]|nr:nuclear transport factor 2 family protein [Solirubrobacteraceae bacterium]